MSLTTLNVNMRHSRRHKQTKSMNVLIQFNQALRISSFFLVAHITVTYILANIFRLVDSAGGQQLAPLRVIHPGRE